MNISLKNLKGNFKECSKNVISTFKENWILIFFLPILISFTYFLTFNDFWSNNTIEYQLNFRNLTLMQLILSNFFNDGFSHYFFNFLGLIITSAIILSIARSMKIDKKIKLIFKFLIITSIFVVPFINFIFRTILNINLGDVMYSLGTSSILCTLLGLMISILIWTLCQSFLILKKFYIFILIPVSLLIIDFSFTIDPINGSDAYAHIFGYLYGLIISVLYINKMKSNN